MRLGDLITLQRGFDLPAQERRDGVVPVVSSSGISGRHSEARIKGPGVVTGRYGTIGQVFYVREDFWPLNTTLFVKDFKGNVPRFVAYLLKTVDFHAHSDKSSVPGVNRNHLHEQKIRAPEPKKQQVIAEILGSFDDKIEINRRMNETLEATARVVYSSLMERKRAKAAGWKTVKAIEAFELVGGGTPKTSVSEFWDGDIPWFSVVDTPSEGDVWVLDTERKITQAGLDSCAAEILPEGTTIVTARGTVGQLALVGVPMAMNQSCYAVRGREPLGPFLAYYSLRGLLEILKRRSHGSIFDTITRDTFRGIEVCVPPSRMAAEFESNIRPIFEQLRSNLRQTGVLAATRDILLPKLMSGEGM